MSEAPGPDDGGTRTETPQAPGPQQPFRAPLPPTPPDRGGVYAMWLGLGGLVTLYLAMSLLIPAVLFVGFAMSTAAVVIGVRARRRAKRVLAPVPGAVAGIVAGSLGLLLLVSSIAVLVVAIGPFRDYMKCRDAANTNTDIRLCQNEYFPRLEHKLHLPAGSLERDRSHF